MPLNAEAKSWRIGAAQGLDLSVRGRRFDAQSQRRAIDPLGVQRIDRNLALRPQRRENPTRREIDVMNRSILRFARLSLKSGARLPR